MPSRYKIPTLNTLTSTLLLISSIGGALIPS